MRTGWIQHCSSLLGCKVLRVDWDNVLFELRVVSQEPTLLRLHHAQAFTEVQVPANVEHKLQSHLRCFPYNKVRPACPKDDHAACHADVPQLRVYLHDKDHGCSYVLRHTRIRCYYSLNSRLCEPLVAVSCTFACIVCGHITSVCSRCYSMLCLPKGQSIDYKVLFLLPLFSCCAAEGFIVPLFSCCIVPSLFGVISLFSWLRRFRAVGNCLQQGKIFQALLS